MGGRFPDSSCVRVAQILSSREKLNYCHNGPLSSPVLELNETRSRRLGGFELDLKPEHVSHLCCLWGERFVMQSGWLIKTRSAPALFFSSKPLISMQIHTGYAVLLESYVSVAEGHWGWMWAVLRGWMQRYYSSVLMNLILLLSSW